MDTDELNRKCQFITFKKEEDKMSFIRMMKMKGERITTHDMPYWQDSS